jgi:hypothetical protein
LGYTLPDRQKRLIVTLAHYVHEGHELDWTELSWRADPEVSEGEESHKLIVRDREALSRIYQRLKYGRRW